MWLIWSTRFRPPSRSRPSRSRMAWISCTTCCSERFRTFSISRSRSQVALGMIWVSRPCTSSASRAWTAGTPVISNTRVQGALARAPARSVNVAMPRSAARRMPGAAGSRSTTNSSLASVCSSRKRSRLAPPTPPPTIPILWLAMPSAGFKATLLHEQSLPAFRARVSGPFPVPSNLSESNDHGSQIN